MKITSILCLIFILNSCKEVRNNSGKIINTDDLDFIQLYGINAIPKFQDYNSSTNSYLTYQSDKESHILLINDDRGLIKNKFVFPKEGPGKIVQIFDILLDTRFIYILAYDELLKIDIQSKRIILRKKLPSRIIQFHGGNEGRIACTETVILASYYSEKDVKLGMGSEDFLKKATIIKVFNKNTLSMKKKLSFPKNTVYHKGFFQPTLYEPIMAIDKKNNELEILFPLEKSLFIYNLTDLLFKHKNGLPDYEHLFPIPIGFKNSNRLKNNFQRDNSKAKYSELFNFNGNTLIGLRYKDIKHGDYFLDNIDYFVLNDDGIELVKFNFDKFNKYNYIKEKKNEFEMFTMPNIDLLNEDPKGFPLYINNFMIEN